ncbi:MAG: hypothetical protein Q8J97_04095 [Flavobacteriaceae bacterium]|nr:hypothetical protein [Flavobacteriaceae bacterium]
MILPVVCLRLKGSAVAVAVLIAVVCEVSWASGGCVRVAVACAWQLSAGGMAWRCG